MAHKTNGATLCDDEAVKPVLPVERHLWRIHGHDYDLSGFVEKHPGGRMAILSGRGRECTALFESYHPWNDKHRKTLAAYGPAPPPPEPFYEELKTEVRKAFPGGAPETKMPWLTLLWLSTMWCILIYLFFFVQTLLACAVAGVIMGTIGTRLSHEGAHWQISKHECVNRAALFLGYFVTGPSMIWYYRHVISHHAHTNQKEDVDVEYFWMLDMMPKWMKMLSLPFILPGAGLELGPKGLVDLLLRRCVGGHHVDWQVGSIPLEAAIWVTVHYLFGPSLLGYIFMYVTLGLVFLPSSQVAHAIFFPSPRDYDSWAKMQIAESADFASESTFWFHMAFGLTTQIEHHLFPGIGHHCYDKIRLITRDVCRRHGVPHVDISAKKAFGALWTRFLTGVPASLA
jgi:fatty acid desaturase